MYTGRKAEKGTAANGLERQEDNPAQLRRSNLAVTSTRSPPPARAEQTAQVSSSAALSGPRNSGKDQLNNRIFFRLFQLGNELQRRAVQQLGITTVQWAVLGALSQDKFVSGMRLSELGDYLVVTRQNLDGVLKRLERDGLVQRVAGNGGDKRARIVQLTEHGREFWREMLERIYLFYDQAAAHISFDERVTLVHHLNELQKALVQVELPKAGLPRRAGG